MQKVESRNVPWSEFHTEGPLKSKVPLKISVLTLEKDNLLVTDARVEYLWIFLSRKMYLSTGWQ